MGIQPLPTVLKQAVVCIGFLSWTRDGECVSLALLTYEALCIRAWNQRWKPLAGPKINVERN
jgi:hypothetical protein